MGRKKPKIPPLIYSLKWGEGRPAPRGANKTTTKQTMFILKRTNSPYWYARIQTVNGPVDKSTKTTIKREAKKIGKQWQDLYYEGDSDTLYTGRVIILHGSLEGLPDRFSLYYFEYSDALFQTYRPNKEGRMPACGIGELKDGKRDGVWTVYRQSDGSKVSESFYKEGRKVSDDKYWNRKGETVDSREEARK